MFHNKKMTAEKLASLTDTLGKLQAQRETALHIGTNAERALYNSLIVQTLERTSGFKYVKPTQEGE